MRASCGDFERTDDTLTVDIAAHYLFTDRISLFGRMENVTGEEDILGPPPLRCPAEQEPDSHRRRAYRVLIIVTLVVFGAGAYIQLRPFLR